MFVCVQSSVRVGAWSVRTSTGAVCVRGECGQFVHCGQCAAGERCVGDSNVREGERERDDVNCASK